MTTPPTNPNKLPLLLIFLVVLVDVTSWAMVIPILPTYAKRFQADEFTVGLLLATYAVTQFVFAPILGRLSDRIGRKPVLVVSMIGTVLACTLTGIASTWVAGGLALLFVSRALDGVTGGNIATAQSYVADVTTPEKRAQGMGMVGAAIGLGYTFGPAFSGLIARHFGISMPFYVAAGVAFCNLVAVSLFLPETLTPEKRKSKKEQSDRFSGVWLALQNPRVSGLLVVCFLHTLAAMQFMSMLALFTQSQLGFVEENNAYFFGFLGLLTTIVQGGLIRPLVRRFTEFPVMVAGLGILGAGLLMTTQAYSPVMLYMFGAGLAIGTALIQPTVLGLVSRRSRGDEQGETIGLTASVSSLGRIFGPAWGGLAFKHFGAHAPFYSGAVICLIGLAITALFVPHRVEEFNSKEEIAVR